MIRQRRASAAERADLPVATIRTDRRFSIVWVVPVIAAVIGAVLVYQTWFTAGPTITIRFEDGAGLTLRQTPVRYRGVECGIVDSVAFNKNADHVEVRVALKKEGKDLAREGAKFWIVRPQVNLFGVRGLETIVSGPYIQAMPGSGAPARQFTGLANAPPLDTLEPGLEVLLRSARRGALRVGSPVYYRDVEVGTVKGYHLTKDAETVEIEIHIEASHASLVRTTSRFWNVGGLQLNVGPTGANVGLESMESLLTGGVAFDTPQGTGAPAKDGMVFRLQDKPSEEAPPESAKREAGLRITLMAKTLAGLAPGSPVSYRQVQVGAIEKVDLAPDARWVNLTARIDDRYRPLVRNTSEFWNTSGVNVDVGLTGAKVKMDSLKEVITGGIQFATPETPGTPVNDGAGFYLHEKPESSWTDWAPAITLADGSRTEETVVQRSAPQPTRARKLRKR